MILRILADMGGGRGEDEAAEPGFEQEAKGVNGPVSDPYFPPEWD